ncbi:S26 family signal peptidase [Caulobacter sp. FWC2]|uniref:S26 family signal peptidase n=1 Tax=Caulobacter sp. FWC2 TaxID=69664 RepID=UPI000C1592B0|nr:S26 family signal peptidase [Caulobacter sp. FWC2]PIB92600.1 peptidase [Caulobacter sp. FWC2]
MTARSRVIAAAAVGCALVLAPLVMRPGPRLVYNATSSAPVGFYWHGTRPPRVGDLALVRPPPPLARWMASRHYLPLNVPLIKRIAAVEGQAVCIQSGVVTIDGVDVGIALRRDLLGRRLTPSVLCRRLGPDEIFLLNSAPRSLDGRYFGPLSRRCVLGRVTPLWTWGR